MAAKVTMITYWAIFFLLAALPRQSNAVYNVVDFGAKADGKTDSSKAFMRAWSSACNSRTPATVYVPLGSFVIYPVEFSGPCKSQILFRIDGTLLAPPNYWDLGNSGYWLLFYKVTSLSVYGGTLDAKGASYWACRRSGKACPPGARSISFVACRNIEVNELTSMNSQIFHIAIDQCHNILLQNIKISAPSGSLNTDGVHVQSSAGITITKSSIKTGDDCISIGPGSKNVWIQGIACGPGHGISIGSLAEHTNEDGVQNVTVTGAVFTRTQNGVRIKSWGRPCTGFAMDIVFRNILMKNAYNPIIIDQNYCPGGHGCPHQNSGVKISRVTYKKIRGTSASQVAMNFSCSRSNPCAGLNLQDIKLTYYGGATAKSSCANANGRSRGIVIPPSCL